MTPLRLPAATLALLALALPIAGCGEDADPSGLEGTVVTGPGVRPVPPPFPPEKEKLPQRIRLLGLPPVGKEKFHEHAQLRIYVDGLLVKAPTNMGLDYKRRVFSPIHTHVPSGVLHFESDKPFKRTLGDVFAIWGVTFGPEQLGSLKNGDGRELRVYVDGKQISDPASYEIKKDDNIVIAFGTGEEKIDVTPDTKRLRDTNAGKEGCGLRGLDGKDAKSCLISKDS
jgi:hypothetical protein